MTKRTPAQRVKDAIEFIECLRIPEGQHVGKPLRLHGFQKRFIRDIYGSKAGTRNAYLSVSRKNGKSALVAALLLLHIVGPEAKRNSQVVSGARSRDQAALVWSLAAKMIDLCPHLQEVCHVIPSSKQILGLPMNVQFRALSADGAKNMGISPVLAILDEVGQVVGPTDYFTDSVTSSQGAHENPLLIAISTQAPSDADMWSIWLDDAERGNDPHTVCHIYRADEDCDLMDKKQWRKANPALGSFLNEKYLAQEMTRASRLKSEEAKARNLYLNQRVAAESLWITPSVYKECGGEPDLDVLRRNGVHVGLDLSQKHDLTGVALAAADDDGVVHLKCYAFSPLGGIEDRSKRDRVPYDQWQRDGIIISPPGDTMSYDWIAQWLRIEFEEQGFEPLSIQFDRWRVNEWRAACEREGFAQGCEWVEVGQGFQSMTSRCEAFESLLLEKKLRHGMYPPLNLGAASAVLMMDPAGGKKLAKNKSSQKIDVLQAAVQAVHPITHNAQQPADFDIAWV